ncbi:hypothetical protein INR49_005642 [Caranx melampygus]|nr:hypothetical protein INR49_005642 [Caranx melampygus]
MKGLQTDSSHKELLDSLRKRAVVIWSTGRGSRKLSSREKSHRKSCCSTSRYALAAAVALVPPVSSVNIFSTCHSGSNKRCFIAVKVESILLSEIPTITMSRASSVRSISLSSRSDSGQKLRKDNKQ